MANTFGALKTELCEELTLEACQKLCVYFEISPAKTESILKNTSQGLALLEELQSQGMINSGNLSTLLESFRHEKLNAAAKKVEDYQHAGDLDEASSLLPDDLDSDEDQDVTEEPPCNMSFEDFMAKWGLTETLTLKKMLEIKCPKRDAPIAELFWEKITSLDYRIISSHMKPTYEFNVRDLIFAILHCSDNCLRQDIMNKMSSCQLAVPLVLNGLNKGKPVLMYWAMRNVRKKIKTMSDNDPIERPMYKHQTFTVSFLRIGEIRVSKSELLNSLLSECQGNQPHSFFIGKTIDKEKPTFSVGSIEIVWYIPESDDKSLLKNPTAFLNLRGDSQRFQIQTKFLCKVSNLVFVLIGKQNWKAHKDAIETIKKMAGKVQILALREDDNIKSKENLDLRYESVIIVRKMHMMTLNKEICRRIYESQKSDQNLWSLENYKANVQNIVAVDISDEYLARLEGIVTKIVPKQIDVKQFKNKILRLFPAWVEWAGLDERTYTTESGIEEQREEQKVRKRQLQNDTEMSDEVKSFWELLRLVDDKSEFFDDCLMYLQTFLFDLTHMHQGTSESAKKFLQDRLKGKTEDNEAARLGGVDLNQIYINETRAQWQVSVGMDDFMRELRQLFEARTHFYNGQDNATDILRLPLLAAKFIAKGHSLEILDDKSYCVPVRWISSIFDELSDLLGETAKVLVVSVIGVQGSGKSTLLNSMFGTGFPVSAGRCTSGLFLRLLKVEEEYATDIGCNYIIAIDTEGLQGDHGGLDETISTRLDNKIVTLAMCISDLTIVNIASEIIGSDMTNFLQIAAYALIRMKQVDLQSQCRIIQRVSDVTAASKNKTNMLKIVANLDEAVKKVAEAEGFVDRYESFCDIFKLNVDDHTQYVCSLWSGNMNPPNPLYGEVVTKFKEQLLENISSGQLIASMTFKAFVNNLLGIHEALKEENFVFKFEDVSRAIAYNEFSLRCNKWRCNVQIEVMETWKSWQRQMRIVEGDERETLCKNLHDELAEVIGKHKETVTRQFESYVQNSKGPENFHNKYFKSWINTSLAKIKCDIESKILNEAKALQFATRDIPSFVEKEATKIRHKAVETAACNRESDFEDIDSNRLQEHFDQYWESSVNSVLQIYQSKRVEKNDIIEDCTKILITVCNGNAIESDILRLLEREGSISVHSNDFDTNAYIPQKPVLKRFLNSLPMLLWKREQMTETVSDDVDRIKSSTIQHFQNDCYRRPFDTCLVYTTLQKTLYDLIFKGDKGTVRVPSLLIAKLLLHLCGRISEIAATNDQRYHAENSCYELFDKYKQEIKLDFETFYLDTYQDERACEYVRNLILQQFRVYILDNLRSRIVKYFCENVVKTKRHMHMMVLRYLFHENKPLLYLDYIHNNVDFLISWMKETMTRKLETTENDMSWTEFQYQTLVENIRHVANNSVQALSEANSMVEWCAMFSMFLSDELGIQVDLSEASIYRVLNLPELSTNIVRYCQLRLLDKVKESLQLPDINNPRQCEEFLERTLNSPFKDVVKNFIGCDHQCPFCKAPCREETTENHTHEAFCHYPRGLVGKKWESNKLVEQPCEVSVASKEVWYGNDGEFFLYKDYRKHHPDWEISIIANQERYYWTWVFRTNNAYCSSYYSCDCAEIPAMSLDRVEEMARAFLADWPPLSIMYSPLYIFERTANMNRV